MAKHQLCQIMISQFHQPTCFQVRWGTCLVHELQSQRVHSSFHLLLWKQKRQNWLLSQNRTFYRKWNLLFHKVDLLLKVKYFVSQSRTFIESERFGRFGCWFEDLVPLHQYLILPPFPLFTNQQYSQTSPAIRSLEIFASFSPNDSIPPILAIIVGVTFQFFSL